MSVLIGVGRVVDIVRNTKVTEICRMAVANFADQLFRTDPALLGLQHGGGAVCIVGAHVVAFVAAQPLESHPDISLYMFQQVSHVDGAIGVW